MGELAAMAAASPTRMRWEKLDRQDGAGEGRRRSGKYQSYVEARRRSTASDEVEILVPCSGSWRSARRGGGLD